MAQLVRWILILPAAVVAWYAAPAIGILLQTGVDALCPSDQVVSGLCGATWYSTVSAALICFGAGLAALFVLVACTLLAPSHKREVAIGAFVIGAVVAGIMGFSAQVFGAFATSVVAGALALVVILRRLAPLALPNTSLERTRGR